MKKIVIFMIEIYQKISRKHLPKMCRYTPTCSEYTKQAIKKYGIFKGGWKGFLRILRCNPFFEGGIDELK